MLTLLYRKFLTNKDWNKFRQTSLVRRFEDQIFRPAGVGSSPLVKAFQVSRHWTWTNYELRLGPYQYKHACYIQWISFFQVQSAMQTSLFEQQILLIYSHHTHCIIAPVSGSMDNKKHSWAWSLRYSHLNQGVTPCLNTLLYCLLNNQSIHTQTTNWQHIIILIIINWYNISIHYLLLDIIYI